MAGFTHEDNSRARGRQGVLSVGWVKEPASTEKDAQPEEKPVAKSGDPSFFKLCDLIAERRRMDSWVLYQRFLRSGATAEEIFWKILWQIKTLLAVKKGAVQNLHSFVLNKNRKYAELFKEEELVNFLDELMEMIRISRYGHKDLSIGLENFILKI